MSVLQEERRLSLGIWDSLNEGDGNFYFDKYFETEQLEELLPNVRVTWKDKLHQTYGQQSYGTYGQPTDVSYTQPQTTATYGQTAYATSYGQPPTGNVLGAGSCCWN